MTINGDRIMRHFWKNGKVATSVNDLPLGTFDIWAQELEDGTSVDVIQLHGEDKIYRLYKSLGECLCAFDEEDGLPSWAKNPYRKGE
jgi:hypothetical protein